MEGRRAHRDAVTASYAVGLLGPDEVSEWANKCIDSLRDLMNCAESHDARSGAGELTPEAVREMNRAIDTHFGATQEALRLFIAAGRATLDRPMPLPL